MNHPMCARAPGAGSDRSAGDRARRGRAEWPRERLYCEGPRSLAEADLLALILRTGDRRRDAGALARELLAGAGGLAALAELAPGVLASLPGLGPAKSASIAAALELGRRLGSVPLVRGQAIRSPEDVQRHFGPRFRGRPRESFHVLLLDARHRLMAIDEVSVGTLTASLVHPREVFREAIRQAAAALLLVHHHPSGDPSPSPEDRSVTERLAAAGRLLGIGVVDHVIVSDGGFFSFQQAGCLEAIPPR
ncbi:MAG: DNA repair protein RadC [Myxococcota bacterium]